MCHQSVGLIARTLEASGLPTLSLSSAWSITRSVHPPRAAFVDFPLGHTSGRPHDREEQRALVTAALAGFETITEPGTILHLPFAWGDDGWREAPLGDGDTRGQRAPTPQYQTVEDAALAAARLGEDVACAACVGFDA